MQIRANRIGSAMFSALWKLNICRQLFIDWKKVKFGSFKPMLETLKAQLSELQALKPVQTDKVTEREIIKQIDEILIRQEMY